MKDKKIEKLHLKGLRIKYWSYKNQYEGHIEFANKEMKFELNVSDMICREMIRLVAYEIRNAKNVLADELELSVAETLKVEQIENELKTE